MTRDRIHRGTWLVVCVVVAASLPLAGCGDGSSSASVRPHGPAPTVSDAWSRASAPGQTNGVVYLTIHGGSAADTLTGASVPQSVSASVELHQTMDMGSGSTQAASGSEPSMADMDDMIGMGLLGTLAVPAGSTIAFAPGGKHVMLVGLKAPLVSGQRFTVTLRFAHSGAIQVPVEVRDQ